MQASSNQNVLELIQRSLSQELFVKVQVHRPVKVQEFVDYFRSWQTNDVLSDALCGMPTAPPVCLSWLSLRKP